MRRRPLVAPDFVERPGAARERGGDPRDGVVRPLVSPDTLERPHLSPDAIGQIIERLEARTRRKVEDHDLFHARLENIAWEYLQTRVDLDEGPTAKEIRIAYERINNHFDAFYAEFDRVVDFSGFGMALGNALFDVHAPNFSWMVVNDEIERLRKDIERIGLVLYKALGEARKIAEVYSQGGNQRRPALKLIIPGLANLYEETVGLRAGTSREIEDGGPFVAFVNDFLDHVEPGMPNRRALAQTVHVALQRERARRG